MKVTAQELVLEKNVDFTVEELMFDIVKDLNMQEIEISNGEWIISWENSLEKLNISELNFVRSLFPRQHDHVLITAMSQSIDKFYRKGECYS